MAFCRVQKIFCRRAADDKKKASVALPPVMARPIAIVVMIQSIFHLSLYAEIEIVSRGNGNKNLPYLIGEFTSNNIGAASATGIFAVILANIVAIFLLRMVGKSMMD